MSYLVANPEDRFSRDERLSDTYVSQIQDVKILWIASRVIKKVITDNIDGSTA